MSAVASVRSSDGGVGEITRVDGDQVGGCEMEPYRELWCAVLLEQVQVVLGKRGQTSLLERQRTRNWFRSEDFFEVCLLAGVDPLFVRDRVNQQLAEPV